MQVTSRSFKRTLIALFVTVNLTPVLYAQSTDQNFPTPVRTNEISGTIKARDIGDSRLTSHFYTFEGGQGDIFINVQTKNFSGDVDIYAVPGLRPLTKMVMYADDSSSETGRVVYLRKPETILLRVEGRTPGDEEATYRIKFAGSFLASRAPDEAPEIPKVSAETQSNVRVNSVGTIIEVIPKPTPAPEEEPVQSAEKAGGERVAEEEPERKAAKNPDEPEVPKQEVVVTDPLADKESSNTNATAKAPARRTSRARRNASKAAAPPTEKVQPQDTPTDPVVDEEPRPPAEVKAAATKGRSRSRTSKSEAEKAVDPMAGINLVIRFKDGSVIERPMTEVLRFSVERAVLTVISKNGTIGRYQMVDVAGVTIE